jgi:3,4-dihydroxy-9,10-secoandrosta-1,3,5(10)-triene-9,17-dione 4,5-dioxygenase
MIRWSATLWNTPANLLRRIDMKIASLGYVGIESTRCEDWESFATTILGMAVAPNIPDDGPLYLKMDEYPWRFCIFAGEQDRFAYAGWELATEAEFEAARAELDAAGVAWHACEPELARERRVRDLIWLQDPAGNRVELVWGMGLDYERLNSPVGVSGFVTGHHGDMGLGHFVIPTSNFSETLEFYTGVLGFAVTDYMHFHFKPEPGHPGQGLYFLHCDNPRHHSLALFQDDNPAPSGLVHLMVEVPDIDELGLCRERCKEQGVNIMSDLGRHTNDRMLSVYIESPAGFALEYGCDGLQLDWDNYTPTVSATPSIWGHDWGH